MNYLIPITCSRLREALVTASILAGLLLGCHREEPTDLLLSAEREAPVGWVRVRLFRDSTFELSLDRGSWKRGTFRTARDTFYFDYLGETDSQRHMAVIRDKRLCFLAGDDACSDFAEITYRRPAE